MVIISKMMMIMIMAMIRVVVIKTSANKIIPARDLWGGQKDTRLVVVRMRRMTHR